MTLDQKNNDYAFMGGDIHACPMRGHSTSFQLVDEFGDGKPYAGLPYRASDYEGSSYTGRLDATGTAKIENHYRGTLILQLNKTYEGAEQPYKDLKQRPHYPLPITELQVRAEKTQLFNRSGARTQENRAKNDCDVYCQVEVSELVEHTAHLPPIVERHFEPAHHVLSMMPSRDSGTTGGKKANRFGIGLLPNRHHILEIRPLRALRPILSTANEFCALNMYQLALMSTLSYTPFGQDPDEHPVFANSVTFNTQPSSGHWFGNGLATSKELWQVDGAQTLEKPYFPLYEDVPYSRRLEIVPFDPDYYSDVNDPKLGDQQEHPANINFLDDSKSQGGTETQAFITHHDELILIAVRGTAHGRDIARDLDAHQVDITQGIGRAHRGFYQAAKVAYEFATNYLDKFYAGQKIIITGHSLGGAIALLLAEMLRRDKRFDADILLYTYGAPRAADQTFVDGAQALAHHRIVNHNDPVPALPGTRTNTNSNAMVAGVAVAFANVPLGVSMFYAGVSNLTGVPYAHHGTLHHFMPVAFENGDESAMLWRPGCDSITDNACNEYLRQVNGLPSHRAVEPIFYVFDHLMSTSYIPNSWATLRRWQESQESKRLLVTLREFEWVDSKLQEMIKTLQTEARKTRPDAHQTANRDVNESLAAEIHKTQITRERLMTLRRTASDADVYGHQAAHPHLMTEILPRWRAIAINTKPEQLALAPPLVEDNEMMITAMTGGHTAGAPYHLDIDSII